METIEIKDINGVVLFTHTAENNTVKLTVEEAVKKNVCLTLADLGDANLEGAYLIGADLAGANLKGAKLEGADLRNAALNGADLVDANLSCAHLICADLVWANLYMAKLQRAKLQRAKLYSTNLNGADLVEANLVEANLIGANLEGTNLSWANLEGANLTWAKLKDADLRKTDLTGANLKDADLRKTDLTGANLKKTYLEDAILHGVILNGAKNIPYIPLACPSEGAFVGWKKVEEKYLVKLQIPEDARRLSATTRKCRCDKAVVLDITSLDGETHFDEVVNHSHKETTYKVGEMVYPDSFNENRWCECSNGIHFFINKKDAIEY